MHIVPPGGFVIPPRLKFNQLVGTAEKPLEKPLRPRRLKIVAPTACRGHLLHVGTVIEFDTAAEGREDFSLLLSCMKAVVVPLSTTLFTAPAPVEPPPMPVAPAEKQPGVVELAKALLSAMKQTAKA